MRREAGHDSEHFEESSVGGDGDLYDSRSTILRQLPCSKNWKSYKIETKDIDTQVLDAILALGVGCRLMV